MAAPPTFTFVIGPVLPAEPFEPLELEVPTFQSREAAARRAWWAAFHLLGPRGYEPEDFIVWDAEDGRRVGSGGYVDTLDKETN